MNNKLLFVLCLIAMLITQNTLSMQHHDIDPKPKEVTIRGEKYIRETHIYPRTKETALYCTTIATMNGITIVGQINYVIANNPKQSESNYIQTLLVNPQFRHRGIGEYLGRYAMSIYIKKNIHAVKWAAFPFDKEDAGKVEAMDRLVGWYQKLGGKITKKIKNGGQTHMQYTIPLPKSPSTMIYSRPMPIPISRL